MQKHRFKGFIFNSLSQFLYSDYWQSVFDTYEVCIFDGDHLVAVSYFDVGEESVASILGLHDPEYKKFSLGMYTMLVEVQLAMEKGKKYYYPGYVLDNSPKFDYKLRLGPMEYYDWHGKWLPLEEMVHEKLTGNVLKQVILDLHNHLEKIGIPSKIRLNPFFSIGYLDQLEEDFLQSSIFLQIEPESKDNRWLIVEYMADHDMYSLCWVQERGQYQDYFDSDLSTDVCTRDAKMFTYLECIADSYEVEEIVSLIFQHLLKT